LSKLTFAALACSLVPTAAAQVNQFIGPSPNSTIVLDFDNPFVASGPIASNSSVFTSAGITSVSLVGSWAPGGDTLTAASNVMGQGLISQGGVLTVATAPAPLDNGAAGSGYDIVFAQTHTEFQVLFIDQVNHTYSIQFFNGATSLGSGNFVYSGGFPNPPHYWTTTGPFDRVIVGFPSGVAGAGLDNFAVDGGGGQIGTNYCTPGVPNSTGASGEMSASGSASVGNNDLVLEASSLPNNAFGFFLTSMTQGSVPQPGGSQGVLCLGGSIGRYVGPGQVQNTGLTGGFSLAVDLTQHPTPIGLVSVAAGEVWNFQGWHRDAVGGVATSNFTDGYEITFVP
jgi:hypothetical protein